MFRNKSYVKGFVTAAALTLAFVAGKVVQRGYAIDFKKTPSVTK